MTQIFLLFFRNSFFFVCRHSNLEGSFSNGTKSRPVNLVVACGPYQVTRSDVGLHDVKYLRKENVERIMRVLGRSGTRVVTLSPCFMSGVGVKYCWNTSSSIPVFETSS